VTSAVVALIGKYWEDFLRQTTALSVWQLLVCAGAVTLGKVLLSMSAWHAAQAQGWHIGSRTAFAVIAFSQLGKYIPGGIWHFVGRGALYAAHGQRTELIVKSLLVENVWQWASALLVGTVFLTFAYQENSLFLPLEYAGPGIAVLLTVAWISLFRWSRRRFSQTIDTSWPSEWSILALQAGAWMCFGISVWVLFPDSLDSSGLVLAVGSFALATLAGFLVPLAPAGLGVREVVLVALLSLQLDLDQAAACAVVSRLAWIMCEAAIAGSLYRWVYPSV
jgi:hypothetical protein